MSNLKCKLWLVTYDYKDNDDIRGDTTYCEIVIAGSEAKAKQLFLAYELQSEISDMDPNSEYDEEMIVAARDKWGDEVDKDRLHAARIPEEELLCRTPRVLKLEY